ncbi:MAG TPA: hypothetical protein VFN89_03290 [Solirubrobacterales bacterium]|nr:hypothetical protein [Solirubrobacterales bacterium]
MHGHKIAPRVHTRLLAVLVAVLVAATLTACGGGNGDPSAEAHAGHGFTPNPRTAVFAASPPMSKPKFLAYINGVCRKAWVELAENWQIYLHTSSQKLNRQTRYAEAVQHSLLGGIVFHIFDDIQMLGSPRGDERAVEEIIGPLLIPAKAGESGKWRARSAAEVTSHFTVYNRRADRYGLRDCLVNRAHLRRFKP